ncbi:unnamed protein product [Trichobilharzia regenti]|nr:unnamed protein product [Trichobilharzia regenti]
MPSLIDSQYRSTSDENKNMLEDTNYVLKELTIQQQQQQENGIPQLWASSTPKEEESPNSSYTSMENDTPTKTISAELNTLTNRLREESLRLATATAIATSRQPVCERPSTILVNKPVNQTEEAIKVEADTVSSPWMNEIRGTYADLKEAVSEVSKFRKCLVEVLHVEEASFKSELKTHINRSDTLVEEINRLTQLVSSRSEELDHANNRTNELCSQLGDLKVELIHTQHELQSKSSEVDNHLTNIEHLRLEFIFVISKLVNHNIFFRKKNFCFSFF